jgi:hypothetical protein
MIFGWSWWSLYFLAYAFFLFFRVVRSTEKPDVHSYDMRLCYVMLCINPGNHHFSITIT